MRSTEWSALTDQELVLLALQYHEAASEELVERYREKVFAIAVRILEDMDAADSAWQETFVRVFRSLAHYQPERDFGRWIKRIARNAALDKRKTYQHNMLRIHKATAADETNDSIDPDEIPETGPSPLDRLVNLDRLRRVTFAMASLDPRHRQAILLHLDGVDHKQIAEQLGTQVNTVNTWIFRCRATLTRCCA